MVTATQTYGKHAGVNGIQMYYEIHGSGSPLVLIHGGGSTIETTFGQIMPALAKAHQVIAVELQAHGRTSDRDAPESFEQDADDVAALMQQLNISKADFFGFSNGGTTTLQLAICHPQLVNKIIVASGMYKRAGAYPWFWEFMKKGTFEDMPQMLKDAYLAVNNDAAGLRTMHDKDLARMQQFKDIDEAAIAGIQSPALIINGDKDVVTNEHAVEMQQKIPNARLLIVPGGHGEYIGEITTIKPGQKKDYPALAMIEAFLKD